MADQSTENSIDHNILDNTQAEAIGVIEASESPDVEQKSKELLQAFLESKGISDYEILSISSTRKSTFGEIRFADLPHFFKIANASDIQGELEGYKRASVYPHEKVTDHFFNDSLGLIIQDYCEDARVQDGFDNVFINSMNRQIFRSGQDARIPESGIRTIETLGRIYSDTVTAKPVVYAGHNDRFFYDRLASGDRMTQYYSGQEFVFPGANQVMSSEDLFHQQIRSLGGTIKINDLIDRASINLRPDRPRTFVLSPGDPTESNFTVNGKFFDFETAGLNSLAQDMAIFLYFTFVYGNYVSLKYSKSGFVNSEGIDPQSVDEQLKSTPTIDSDTGILNIETEYRLPELKRELIKVFLEKVIVPTEARLGSKLRSSIVEELKSALFMRIMAVRNILKFERKDMSAFLSFLPYFCDEAEYPSVSEYVQNKFINYPRVEF